MAKRPPPTRRRERGGTLYGALAGLLAGLIVAAAVAFYVTQAPMPFVDKASREAEQTALPDPRQAPDPNSALYGRDGPAGTVPAGPTATAPMPLAEAPPGQNQPGHTPSPSDDLGALIATLPKTPEPAANAKAGGTYFLQAGAFRVLEDAESLKARILLMGLPAAVQRAEVNGMQVNRVRVGPFARLDDMNRARSQMGENKIDSAVVRQ